MPNPLRVAVVSRIYRPEPSAASFFLGGVVDSLLQAGHKVDVITAKPPKGMRPVSNGERVRTFPVLRDRNNYVRGYLQYLSFDLPLFFRLLFLPRPDVVFMEPPPTTGLIVRIACAIRRIPYVYDAADIWSDAADNATDSKVIIRALRAFERFGLQGASQIVTISAGVERRLTELGIHRPVHVTGFGADTRSFFYESREIEPVFLYAGSYSTWHGAEILIDAFAEFSQSHSGYKLRFIGNSTERQKLADRAKQLGIGESVEFLGTVPAAELRPQLTSSVASLATLKPGGGYDYAFTTKAYSSLAAGCPVIFAGCGPTIDFLEQANQHVAAGNVSEYAVSAIAHALKEAASSPPNASMRAATAKWIDQHHSMRAVTERVSSIIASAKK